MIRKSTLVIAIIATAIIGYIAGSYFGWPLADKDQTEGNLGHVSLFNMDDESAKGSVDILTSDTAQQTRVTTALVVISSRIEAMDKLTASTIEATKSVDALASVNKGMQSLKKDTEKAKAAYDILMQETGKIIMGEGSSSSLKYTQANSDAILALAMLDADMSICSDYIDQMAEYLRYNSNKDVDAVAVQWIEYCAEDAVLNDSPKDIEFWKTVYASASDAGIGNTSEVKLGQFPTVSLALEKAGKSDVNAAATKYGITADIALEQRIATQNASQTKSKGSLTPVMMPSVMNSCRNDLSMHLPLVRIK